MVFKTLVGLIFNHFFNRQFLVYSMVGFVGLATDTLLYTLLIRMSMYPLYANTLGLVAGLLVTFTLHSLITFKKTDKLFLRFISVVGVWFLGSSLSNAMLWIYIYKLGLDKILAKILTLPFVVAFQYTGNKLVSFR